MDFTDAYPITKSVNQNTFEYSPGSTFLASVQHVSASGLDESIQRQFHASSSGSTSSDNGMMKKSSFKHSIQNGRKRDTIENISSLLDIRVSTTLQIVRSWNLPFLIHTIRWSNDGSMILCVGKNRFCVLAVDPRFTPLRNDTMEDKIDLDIGQDTILNVKAGAEGLIGAYWIDNESICSFTSDHLQAMLYDTRSGSVAIINCPKSSKVFVSPTRSYVTFLTGREGVDHITILKRSRESFSNEISDWKLFQEFPTRTNDAIKLCWSPDERYLAVWDGILEFKVQIFSLFGHLQATYSIESDEPKSIYPSIILSEKSTSLSTCSGGGFGIKDLQWSCNGKLIAVGDYYDQIRFLETREWSECKSFDLTNICSPKNLTRDSFAWREPNSWQSNPNERTIVTFEMINLPTILSSIQNDLTKLNPKAGICWMEWNSIKGDLLAVRSESMPNVLFIFKIPVASTQSFNELPILFNVVVFSSPISQAVWRPNNGKQVDELSVVCQSNAIYIWKQVRGDTTVEEHIVEAIPIPIEGFMAKHLSFSPDGRTLIILSDNNTFCCAMDSIDQSTRDFSVSHL